MVEDRNIIIFDGVCNLCNRWVTFIINRDPDSVFSFAPMQGDTARKLTAEHYGEGFNFETILLYKGGVFYERSDAVLEITRALPRCALLFRLAHVTPRPIRDSFYRIVARHRYRIFGKRDQCMIPRADLRDRFIDS